MEHKTEGQVTVFHPGRVLNAYQAALALEEGHLLRHFETGSYSLQNGFPARFAAKLPTGPRSKLQRELNRRMQKGLSDAHIRSHPFWDTLFSAIARSGVSEVLANQVMLIRNERFDRTVASHVLKCRPAAVIGYDSSCLRTFEVCPAAGTLRILDQVIGHLAVGAPLLQEEQGLHPEWADSIGLHRVDYTVNRCLAEAKQADAILAASDYVRATMIQVGIRASKILQLPYGVDVERFVPRTTAHSGVFRALFVGQISQRKGIKYLLEAWKRLKLPNAELVLMGRVAGEGRGLAPYHGLYRHAPSVPYAEVHTYYQSADVFVFPSIHEGSSLAVMEAMASGIPVIATHNSGTLVRDGQEGFIVPIRDIDAIAQRILQMYNNRDLARQLGRQARQRVEEFTWKQYRSRLVNHMETLLSAREPKTQS